MQNIFDDDGARRANINKSAEKLGMTIPNETETKPDVSQAKPVQYGYTKKKGCKFCWGKGNVLWQKPGEITQTRVFCKCVRRVEI